VNSRIPQTFAGSLKQLCRFGFSGELYSMASHFNNAISWPMPYRATLDGDLIAIAVIEMYRFTVVWVTVTEIL
jgi:hypothetical protein